MNRYLVSLCDLRSMTLEKVKNHNKRKDIYSNKILQREEEIPVEEKLKIKKILMAEII